MINSPRGAIFTGETCFYDTGSYWYWYWYWSVAGAISDWLLYNLQQQKLWLIWQNQTSACYDNQSFVCYSVRISVFLSLSCWYNVLCFMSVDGALSKHWPSLSVCLSVAYIKLPLLILCCQMVQKNAKTVRQKNAEVFKTVKIFILIQYCLKTGSVWRKLGLQCLKCGPGWCGKAGKQCHTAGTAGLGGRRDKTRPCWGCKIQDLHRKCFL